MKKGPELRPQVKSARNRYVGLSILAWFVVDLATTGAIRAPWPYYSTHLPALLLFYVGSPLAFAFLIFRRGLRGRGLLVATLAAIVIVEILFTGNRLLLNLPIGLLAWPLSIGVYGTVCVLPLWMAEGSLEAHRRWAWTLGGLCIADTALNILTQFKQ